MCWQSFSLSSATRPAPAPLPASLRRSGLDRAASGPSAWRPTRRGVLAALLGGGLLVLDSALLATFDGAMNWAPTLGAHLGLSAAAALPGFGGSRDARMARVQLAAWTALLGPFGVLIGMSLFLPERAAARRRDWAGREADAPTRLETLRHGLADKRLRIAGGHAVRPLLEVMVEGDPTEKLEALGLVAKRYVPGLAPTLRRALQDRDGSVRVLAATVLAQLNDRHMQRIGALADALEAAPTAGNRQALGQALGQARLDYAESGLLEPDRAAREAESGRADLARAATAEAATEASRAG